MGLCLARAILYNHFKLIPLEESIVLDAAIAAVHVIYVNGALGTNGSQTTINGLTVSLTTQTALIDQLADVHIVHTVHFVVSAVCCACRRMIIVYNAQKVTSHTEILQEPSPRRTEGPGRRRLKSLL